MAKRKTSSKKATKVGRLKRSRFNKWHLLIFTLLIAAVGARVAASFADTSAGFYGSIESNQAWRVGKYRSGSYPYTSSLRLNHLKHIDCLHDYAESQAKAMAKANSVWDPSTSALVSSIKSYCGDFSTTSAQINTGGLVTSKQAFACLIGDNASIPSYFGGTCDQIHKLPLQNKNGAGQYRRYDRIGIGAYKKANGQIWVTMVLAKCYPGCGSGGWSTAVNYPGDPVATASVSSYSSEDYNGSNPDYGYANADTIPLYQYWNGTTHDHFYSLSSSTPPGYVYQDIAGYVYPNNSLSGTTALYRYYNYGNHLHFYTIAPGTACYGYDIGYCGYTYEGTEGYVWKSPPPGMVGLNDYMNANHDHVYTTHPATACNGVDIGYCGYGWYTGAGYADNQNY